MLNRKMLHNRSNLLRKVRASLRWGLRRYAQTLSPLRSRATSGCAVSFFVHLTLILILAYAAVGSHEEERDLGIVAIPYAEEVQPFWEDILVATELSKTGLKNYLTGPPSETLTVDAPEIDLPLPGHDLSEAAMIPAPEADGPSLADLMLPTSTLSGGGFEGRSPAARAALVAQRGGTAESEEAVQRGLAWLAAHQLEDGSWRFDLTESPCGGLCRDSGSEGSTTAATGLALLAFLGAGEIGKQSQYKTVVDRGLYYLTSRLISTPHGGDLQEGTMYAQGIATIALCEAYGLTRDESLRYPAQEAVRFVCNAQHEAGGWRYFPGQPGDATVTGWQWMALKSAKLSGLEVPQEVIHRTKAFLDSIQSDGGAAYGYMEPGELPSPTAIGLLLRMYQGWPQDDPRLARGVQRLEKWGPSRSDMYFNYYATQVLCHYESDGWDAWNKQLRDRLVATQSRRGHENGSWHFHDEHGDKGGRLYTTAMCVMILEVYYRYMPLYGHQAVQGGW